MAHSDTMGAVRARQVLAAIRIINGTLALTAPQLLIGRVGPADPPAPAAVYAFRMFGIRTVLIGRDLLRPDGPERAKAVREAPLIHGCDTATATLLTLTRRVSPRQGVPLIAISALNTALAVIASRHPHDGGRHR